MKKLIFTTFLLGILSACSVDNVETDLILVAGEEINPENVNTVCTPDLANPPLILGSTWHRTGFILESTIDLNGDGVFLNDLIAEGSYLGSLMTFNDDFKVYNPTFTTCSLRVDEDDNGNLIQRIGYPNIDGGFPTYIQNGNIINFCYNGLLYYIGTLSDNEQTLTFNFTHEQIFPIFITDILRQNGTIEDYQGGVIMIYTRQ